jgi:hypothetical protein
VLLDPRRLGEVVGDETVLDQLADEAGLEPRILRDAWRAPTRDLQRKRPPIGGVWVVEPDVLEGGIVLGGHAELLNAGLTELSP